MNRSLETVHSPVGTAGKGTSLEEIQQQSDRAANRLRLGYEAISGSPDQPSQITDRFGTINAAYFITVERVAYAGRERGWV